MKFVNLFCRLTNAELKKVRRQSSCVTALCVCGCERSWDGEEREEPEVGDGSLEKGEVGI